MRIELIIFGATLFFALNHYYDGKFIQMIYGWKKYYQIAGIVLGGLAFYWLIKKAPAKVRNRFLSSSHEYLQYMPIDSQKYVAPVLDFTSKQSWDRGGSGLGSGIFESLKSTIQGHPRLSVGGLAGGAAAASSAVPVSANLPRGSGLFTTQSQNKTKRSVSESKKKWVAANQGWICAGCKRTLPAWFEIDHHVRLENGGTNNVDNLVALCRDCHGKKTMIENL
jgi:hypothetical protein